MKTELTQLPESRVRVEVVIPAGEVATRIDRAARALGGEMRVPGFRQGKAPAALVIQRIGREGVLDQALRDSMPEWYEQAILEAEITPIGDPDLQVSSLPVEGEALEFAIEVGVRPTAEAGEYKGLEVPRSEPEVPAEAVDAEVDRLREGFASLSPVERPAGDGDAVVIDYTGTVEGEPFEGGHAQDFVVELGGQGLLPEFEHGLSGSSAGDEVSVEVDFPEDHEPGALAGKTAAFEVKVREVREKELPELDDEFAADASEFDTLDELRDGIEGRIREGMAGRAENEFREAAVEAAAEAATVEIPEAIAQARAEEMWERVERQLASRGISPDAYLQMQGKTREELIGEAREDAERSLRREAVLTAIADAEGLEPSDQELIEAIGPGDGKEKPEKILKRLRKSGREALLREDVRLRKAAELVVAESKPVPAPAPDESPSDGADGSGEAGKGLWTPDAPDPSESSAGESEGSTESAKGELWTPGRE